MARVLRTPKTVEARRGIDHETGSSPVREAKMINGWRGAGRLRVLCTLAAIGLFVSQGTAAAPANTLESNLTTEPYLFQAEDGTEVPAEMGRLTVPETRSAGSSGTLELAFVRFESTNPNPGPPIVYLAGGPGGSGIAAARGTRFGLFMALRELADVIAFDQRGTGLSTKPEPCATTWSYPPDRPGRRDEMLASLNAYARGCVEQWRTQGVDLSAYTTNASADDLEDLRIALGAEKINLWSISYGTHLALATLKRHESSIDRVIMAGVEGLDHTIKLPSDTQRLMERIGALVAADPVLGEEIPDFLGLVGSVLDRLEREPVSVEVHDRESGETVSLAIGKFDLQLATARALRGPSTFKRLPYLYSKMAGGDFSDVAPLLLRLRRLRLSAMPLAMDIASGASDRRRARVLREQQMTLLGGAINAPNPEIAEGLGVPDLGAAFRMPVSTDVQALFISGTLDGRTPVSNAEEVLAGFSRGVHLIIDGAGHSDPLFLSSPGIETMMHDFLAGHAVVDRTITLPPIDLAGR